MKKISTILCFLFIITTAFSQSTKVSRYIDSFTKKNSFNGTILVTNKSGTAFNKSFGFANIPFKVPNTTDTKYKVASITKAFAAVLVLQLHDEGKLDLDKTISAYLPAFNKQAGTKVTIKQLLNMTSGLPNMDQGITLEAALNDGIPHYQLPNTSDQMLARYCRDTLVDEPGKNFDYNNADFIILGKIIEKVSGKTFAEYLQEKILQPLQMKNSGMLQQHIIIDKLAETYFYREDLKMLTNDLPVYINNWYAAGAMYSTVGDLDKFSKALFNGKLLKSETMKQMFTSGAGEYGYGVWVYNDFEINKKMYTIVKRPGSIMGAQAMLFHVLEAGSTIIILSNSSTVNMDEFAAEIAKRLF